MIGERNDEYTMYVSELARMIFLRSMRRHCIKLELGMQPQLVQSTQFSVSDAIANCLQLFKLEISRIAWRCYFVQHKFSDVKILAKRVAEILKMNVARTAVHIENPLKCVEGVFCVSTSQTINSQDNRIENKHE